MTLTKLFALPLALIASALAQENRFGNPSCSGSDLELADRAYFVVCHSASRKVPVWVGYELTPDHLVRLAPRPSHFRRDAALSHPGALDADYRNSGFSRGHVAPAADFAWSAEAIRATFLLSNAVPQRQHVNAGRWSQLEAAVRRIAAQSDAVYVFSGPIFQTLVPEVIGAGRVAVPTHTYKVILAVRGSEKTMYAAIVPNEATLREPLRAYVTTVAEVERRTGLDFFSRLEDDEEERLESALGSLPD